MTLVKKDGMNVENIFKGVNMADSNISNVSICHLKKKNSTWILSESQGVMNE